MSDDPAVQAVLIRLKEHDPAGPVSLNDLAADLVAILRPIIEAELIKRARAVAADDTILTSASCYEGDHDDCNIGGENHFKCRCECHDVYDEQPSRVAVRTEPIEDLVERSSLGTPEARGLRESVSDEDAREVVRRAAAMNPDLLRPPDRARPETEPEQ